jgi:hypothetical protein
MSSPSDSPTSGDYDGLSPFLAVPVPLYIASGLDPSIEHNITIEKMGAQYLDLDYVEVYKVGGVGPPGGESNPPKPKNDSTAARIGEIVGGILGMHH